MDSFQWNKPVASSFPSSSSKGGWTPTQKRWTIVGVALGVVAVGATIGILLAVRGGKKKTDTGSSSDETYVSWVSLDSASLRHPSGSGASSRHGNQDTEQRQRGGPPPNLPPAAPPVENVPFSSASDFGQRVAAAAKERGMERKARAKLLTEEELTQALEAMKSGSGEAPTNVPGAWVAEEKAYAIVDGALELVHDGTTTTAVDPASAEAEAEPGYGAWVAVKAKPDDMSAFVTDLLQNALGMAHSGVWYTESEIPM